MRIPTAITIQPTVGIHRHFVTLLPVVQIKTTSICFSESELKKKSTPSPPPPGLGPPIEIPLPFLFAWPIRKQQVAINFMNRNLWAQTANRQYSSVHQISSQPLLYCCTRPGSIQHSNNHNSPTLVNDDSYRYPISLSRVLVKATISYITIGIFVYSKQDLRKYHLVCGVDG